MNPKRNTSYTPRWLERLLSREGKGAYGSSKHARGRTASPRAEAQRRKTRKTAKASRQKNRGK